MDKRRCSIGSVNPQSRVSSSSGSTQNIHRHQLKCFYTNANSVVTKIDELRRRTDKGEYDIIGITETWGRPDISDAELAIEGYNMFRMDRQEGIGGGVLLYVNDKLQVSPYQIQQNISFQESLWCLVNCGKSSIVVGVCYRSHQVQLRITTNC